MLCGYPDLYDYDYDSIGGAGYFCLMGYGGFGDNPAQIDAYLKRASGWATTTELDASSSLIGTVTAPPAPTSTTSTGSRSRVFPPSITWSKTVSRPGHEPIPGVGHCHLACG